MNRISVATIGCTPNRLTSSPLKTPQHSAIRIGRPMAAIRPRAGLACAKSDRKISGAKAPASAMTAPTLRSMPPVAMTSVMPIATMAMVAIWLIFTNSVCG